MVQAGFSVRAAYIEPVPPTGWPSEIEWCRIRGLGPDTDWQPHLANCNYVIHLAAIAHRIGPLNTESENEYHQINCLGTRNLVSAVRKSTSVERFVFMSSIGAVTSFSDTPVNEDTTPRPDSAYGRSKLAAESETKAALEGSNTDWCIFRPSLIHGPGNPGNMARLLALLSKGFPLPFGSIKNLRSFLYVENAISALMHGMSSPKAMKNTFCLADSEMLSTPDLMRLIAHARGQPARLFPFPVKALHLLAKMGDSLAAIFGRSTGLFSYSVERLVNSLPVDSSRFRTITNWQQPLTMEQGIQKTVGSVDRP